MRWATLRGLVARFAKSNRGLAATLVATVGMPVSAYAGMCSIPSVTVYPRDVHVLPANAQLHVRLHDGTNAIKLSLVPGRGPTVALLQKREPGERAGFLWLTLTAERALVAGERYKLTVDGQPEWTVGDYAIELPGDPVIPAFKLRSARFVRNSHPRYEKGSDYGHRVVVELEQTNAPLSQLFFQITPLDVAATAPIWRNVDKNRLEFGATGECAYRDLDLPSRGRQRYELRAVDLAGHVSLPVAITVDAGR